MKKSLKILLFVILPVLLVTIAVVVLLNLPQRFAIKAIASVEDDLMKRDEIKDIMKLLEEGSLDINSKSEEKKTSFDGKVYFNLDDSEIYFDAMTYKKNENTEFAFDLYMGEDSIYVTTEDGENDGTYGIERGNSKESFLNSPLSYDSAHLLALPKDISGVIETIFKIYDNEIDKKAIEDFEEIDKEYTKALVKAINSYSEIDWSFCQKKIDGEDVTGRKIVIEIDDDAREYIYEDLLEFFKNGEEVENFIDEYNDYLTPVFVALEIIDEDQDLEDYFENYLKDIYSAYGIGEDDEIEIEIYTKLFSSKLVKLKLSSDKHKDIIVLEAGKKGIKKTDRILYKQFDGTKYTELEYKVKKDTDKQFNAEFLSDSEKSVVIDIDKSKDKYELQLFDGEMIFRGDWKSEKKKLSVSIDEFECDKETIETIRLLMSLFGISEEEDNDTVSSMNNGEKNVSLLSASSLASSDTEVIDMDIDLLFTYGEKMPERTVTITNIFAFPEDKLEETLIPIYGIIDMINREAKNKVGVYDNDIGFWDAKLNGKFIYTQNDSENNFQAECKFNVNGGLKITVKDYATNNWTVYEGTYRMGFNTIVFYFNDAPEEGRGYSFAKDGNTRILIDGKKFNMRG